MKGMLNDFKEFAMRGNVMDMAVGVIIGAAFGKIVTSLVNDVLMPPIGGIDFSNLFISLSGTHAATLAEAQAQNIPVIAYGVFINTVINFLIQAWAIFMVIKFANKLKAEKPAEPAQPPRLCPYCFSEVNEKATRCPHCTSEL
ncbi:large conductance mechanosensitive channel protein MscL [Cloacibacillus evryensis]|uniref:large conductance mechanosensitive channel protein MscL n=1 Tax=Cloacibacillus evryensis TaxID=508460 RepID=UPI003AB443C2